MAVSIAPIGVAPVRMSRMAGAPPQTIGAPAAASWWITTPASDSAACWTTDPARETGAAPPASGIDTIWAGTPARARSMRQRDAKAVQASGGDGQTSNTARGRARSAPAPPASSASSSSIGARPAALNAPVTIGLSDPRRTSSSRYRSPISAGTSPHTTAVDCAAYAGRASATVMSRTRSAAVEARCSPVSGSRTETPQEPGSKVLTPDP